MAVNASLFTRCPRSAFSPEPRLTIFLHAILGDRLGLFRDLADRGPATPPPLAARAGVQERYAREWLRGMTAAGYLELDRPFYCMTTSLAHGGEGARHVGMPEARVRELSTEAGFVRVRRLPIEDPFSAHYKSRSGVSARLGRSGCSLLTRLFAANGAESVSVALGTSCSHPLPPRSAGRPPQRS